MCKHELRREKAGKEEYSTKKQGGGGDRKQQIAKQQTDLDSATVTITLNLNKTNIPTKRKTLSDSD